MGEARAPFDRRIILQFKETRGPARQFALQELEGGPARKDEDMVILEIMTNHGKGARGMAEPQGGDAKEKVFSTADSSGRRGAAETP